MNSDWLEQFLKRDSSSGIVLVVAAIIALVVKNSALSPWYDALLQVPVEVRIGALEIAKPLLLWINDGLMAVFFLLVGLEVKREILEGELSRPDQIVLPAVGALGGMLVPALIYLAFTHENPDAVRGWAIPCATDIAFALGVLSLLGRRVPLSLKVFLMALAIFDDLGAIVIIAVFYTSDLSFTSLLVAGAATTALVLLNRFRVTRIEAYALLGVVLWVAVLKSGVHATLAGVVLGFAIPLRDPQRPGHSPLRRVEHDLHQWVAFLIVPLFAFANAGVGLEGFTLGTVMEPVPLGITLGLFLGKQIGILAFCGVFILAGWARLPAGASWWGFYGVSLLCGVGFTMSLFIASLAFEQGASGYIASDRLGILIGSGLSAVAGYLFLRFAPARSDIASP